MKLQKTVVVDKPLYAVFGYLSDFTTTTEWDPGTVTTVTQHGDGRVGTTYLNTSMFLGRTTELTYVVQELVPGERIRLRGENKSVVAVDTMTFHMVDAGTEVTYQAEFTFKGRPGSSPRYSSPPWNGWASKRKPACTRRSTSSDQPPWSRHFLPGGSVSARRSRPGGLISSPRRLSAGQVSGAGP